MVELWKLSHVHFSDYLRLEISAILHLTKGRISDNTKNVCISTLGARELGINSNVPGLRGIVVENILARVPFPINTWSCSDRIRLST